MEKRKWRSLIIFILIWLCLALLANFLDGLGSQHGAEHAALLLASAF